ncbi:MAG: amino acid ABC transporter permease [Clostridia bacterium]|nr:amino acid ABC transporter permease [Clostridia bacterium]
MFQTFNTFFARLRLWFAPLQKQFSVAFLEKSRWKLLLTGLENTLTVTFFAVLIGLALGALLAVIRSVWDSNRGTLRSKPLRLFLGGLNALSKVYLTVIRGTPVVVQIMILFFVILARSNNKILVAVIAFGLNSAAYVAEIIRGGIAAVPAGQTEAGRSLGFNYVQTMWHIVLPQALKSVLPALANEFISLLKETAVAGYVGLTDLTRAADIIRGATYQSLFPLLAIALVYLSIVLLFTQLIGLLERRLRTRGH